MTTRQDHISDSSHSELHQEQAFLSPNAAQECSLEHLGELLEQASPDAQWLEQAEALSAKRSAIKVLGAALAGAYRRLNRPSQELSVLIRELEVAQGPRLVVIRKRLAALHETYLQDLDGAIEHLDLVLSLDPTDDDARANYVRLSNLQGHTSDAISRITREMAHALDFSLRARLGYELGQLWQHLGETESARSVYTGVLQLRARTGATLAAANALMQLGCELDATAARARLWAECAISQDAETRRISAERLLALCGNDPQLLVDRAEALLALAETDPARSIEWLLSLESLYDEERDYENLAAVIQRLLDAESSCIPRYKLLLAPMRAPRYFRLGALRRDVFNDPNGAIAAWQEVLALEPGHVGVREGLLEWLSDGPYRLRAATILEPQLRATGSYEELLVALGARSELDEDATARLAAAEEAIALFDRALVSPESAPWFCAHGLRTAIDVSEDQTLQWLSILERFCVSNPSVEADALKAALAGRAIDTGLLFRLAIRCASQLLAARRVDEAALQLADAQAYVPAYLTSIPQGEHAIREDRTPEPSASLLDILQGLYVALGDTFSLSQVLELRAAAASDSAVAIDYWRQAAQLAATDPKQSERAARAWRKLLAIAPRDPKGLDGLVTALAQLGDIDALVDALEARASTAAPSTARADLIRAAQLADGAAHTTRALSLWQRVANRFGDDPESANAIADLLEKEQRWVELRDHLQEFAAGLEGVARTPVLVRAAHVECWQLADPIAAVHTFATISAWDQALAMVESLGDAALRTRVLGALVDTSGNALAKGDASAERAHHCAVTMQLADHTHADSGPPRDISSEAGGIVGNYDRPSQALTEDAKLAVRTSAPLIATALAHLENDELIEALEALTEAFELRPRNAELALQVAELALDLSDNELATRALRILTALPTGEENADDTVTASTKSAAYYYLAQLLNQQEDLANAQRMLSLAIAVNSRNIRAQQLQHRLLEHGGTHE